MPFAPKINQDQSGQPQGQGAAPMVSGVSSTLNVPGSGGKVPGAAKTQKSSGQFQNLEKYIQANQPQGEMLGQKIAQNVESKVGEGSSKLQSMATALPQASKYNPQDAIAKAETLQAPEIEAYKQMKTTGGYTGPQDITALQGYGEAVKASEAAKEAVSKAGNLEGQQALLQETFAKPSYTKGANILDQIILAGSQGGKQAIENVGEKYKGLSDLFANQFTGTQGQIEAYKKQAEENKASISEAEKKAMEDLINPLQKVAEKRNIEYPLLQERIAKDIKDYNLSPETLASLGLNVGQNVYGLDLSKYVTSDQTPQTINTVANEAQRQKYQALSSLFDQNAGLLSATNPQDNYKPIDFNKEQFTKDVSAKQLEYNQAQTKQLPPEEIRAAFPAPKSLPEARLQSNLIGYLPNLTVNEMKQLLDADQGLNGSITDGTTGASFSDYAGTPWTNPIDQLFPAGKSTKSFTINQQGWEQIAKPIIQSIVNNFDARYGATQKIGEA